MKWVLALPLALIGSWFAYGTIIGFAMLWTGAFIGCWTREDARLWLVTVAMALIFFFLIGVELTT